MKQKINLRLIVISTVAVLITVIGITFVYYNLFQEQVKKDLKTEVYLLKEAGVTGLIENKDIVNEEEIRITLISSDGTVIYETDADTSLLGNHLNRPEVQEAFTNGYGESVRESDTMNMRTFYAAVLLPDDTVLRIAKEASSMGSVFMSSIPIVLSVLAVVILLCILISHYLTKNLMRPIREMAEDLDHISSKAAYKELDPFVERIRMQHEDILASAKMRQDFTANVSHELKTPITAISGYAELIENKMADEKQQIKFAYEIRKNANRLLSLINDIIRLSELDHTGKKPELSSVDLYTVTMEQVDFLSTIAKERNVTLHLEGENAVLLANREMMVELVGNLIQNAVRYNNPGGSVDITVNKDGNRTLLRVKDTGIGIPEKDQKHVFERFYRVDKSRSRETGGTGLGLAIVKHIVEIHDGEITLQSVEGKGTEIVVLL